MRHRVGADAVDLYCCGKVNENDAIGYENVWSKRARWKWMWLELRKFLIFRLYNIKRVPK